MEQKKRNKTKTVIIVLAVLLALSLVALAGTLIIGKLYSHPGTVTVPDNLITPETETKSISPINGNENSGEAADAFIEADATPGNADTSGNTSLSGGSSTKRKAASINLYSQNARENKAFSVINMFPGDSETRYFRVRVAYRDRVTVHFNAVVRRGYEKLAEVLKVKITLLSTDELLYDGLMRDMPESVTHALSSPADTTEDLFYEIIAYLDTSVGNAYQNKALIADFKWWVLETGNLDDLPFTGDTLNTALLLTAAALSTAVCIVLLVTRKKKEDEADEKG